MKKIIASDIDGVITEFVAPFTQFINTKLELQCDHNKQHHLDIGLSYGIEPSTIHQLHEDFVAAGHYRHLPFVDGAVGALEKLTKKYDLVLITSRRDDLVQTTKDWCQEHLPHAKLFFARGKGNSIAAGTERRTKEDIAVEVGATCLIEDNPHEFLDWNQPNIQPICFARLQNEFLSRSHAHVPRLDWPGIVRYFE